MRYLCFVPAGKRCSVGKKVSPGRSYFSPRFDDNKQHWYSGYLNTSQTLPVIGAYGGEEAAGTSGAEPHVAESTMSTARANRTQ